MDLPASDEARSRAADADRDPVARRISFGHGVDGTHATARPQVPFRQLLKSRIALGVGASGCIALLLYGAAAYHAQHAGPAGVTVRVPAPSQSVAVIKALPPPNLLKPLSPAEAAQENAERPFVPRPDSAAGRFMLRTDADDRTRALTCLAQAVYYEAASEGVEGGRAVAQVVLNRLRHPGFPSTVCGVVYEGAERPTGCQFSFTCDGSLQRIPIPWLWTRSKQIAEEALKGRVFAAVGHATHYHADYVLPYWADSLDKSVQVGRHIFYRLRGTYGDPRAFSQHYGGTEPPFREPGTTVVIPQTPEGEQAANALISDGAPAPAKQDGPAQAKPDKPLLIDATTSTLLIDGPAPPQPAQHSKPAAKCTLSDDRKQLTPLGATEMRSGSGANTC
jgi:hypothetical protein